MSQKLDECRHVLTLLQVRFARMLRVYASLPVVVEMVEPQWRALHSIAGQSLHRELQGFHIEHGRYEGELYLWHPSWGSSRRKMSLLETPAHVMVGSMEPTHEPTPPPKPEHKPPPPPPPPPPEDNEPPGERS